MILALHSSPQPEGNLERMVNAVARASGLEHEIIRLAELEIAPCTGCVRCGRSTWYVQQDDMAPMYQKLESARGLIVGGVNYNGCINAMRILLHKATVFSRAKPHLSSHPRPQDHTRGPCGSWGTLS
ncbi:MAG: flavodoxin family protein [Desulfovermiculus sp.]